MAFTFASLIFIGNSCHKDQLSSTSSTPASNQETGLRGGGKSITISDYGLPTNKIAVSDGMLFFSSYAEVEMIIKYLDSLAYDDAKNLVILNDLGFTGFESDGAPEEPGLELFNEYFGVSSLRQALESLEQTEDQTGQDLSNNINQILFWEPVLGSLINKNHEIRIKNLIYKYIDDNRTVVFRAGDQALLNLVRATPDPFSLADNYNFFKIDSRKEEDMVLYHKVETANMNTECLFDITWTSDGNQFYFHSVGFFPDGGAVVWNILDGNGSIIATQNGFTTFSYLVPAGVTYPLSVSIRSAGCAPHEELFSVSAGGAGYNCELFDFTFAFDPNAANTLTFTIPAFTPLVNWNFGDGVVFATSPTGATPMVISHTYPNGNDYTVCASVLSALCSKTVCKAIGNISCGERDHFRVRQPFTFTAGYQGKAICKISLKDPLFAKTRFFAKIASKEFRVSNCTGCIDRWISKKASKLSAYWHSTPGQNHLVFFKPGCVQVDTIAIKDEFNKSKLKVKRTVPNGTKIKKIDVRCDFYLTTIDNILVPPFILSL